MRRWMNGEVVRWEPFPQGWSINDGAEVRRAYAHWTHAEEALRHATTEFHRIDVITTLKRALDYRLRHLNTHYKWKAIRVRGLPKDQLQLLEYLGVARHAMVLRLIQIRNRIEHQDMPAPTPAECADLVEFVWYFLKSTDVLASRINDLLLLQSKPGFDGPCVELNRAEE